MTETSRKPGAKPITIRFEQATYERLQQLSQDTNENVTEIIRRLISRALDDGGSIELVAHLGAISNRLTAIDRQLSPALPVLAALQGRLDRLEELLCTVDRNAIGRRAIDQAITWKQWSRIVREILAIREGLFATFETAQAQQGRDRQFCQDFFAELTAGAEALFKPYRTKLQGDCAELEENAPPVLRSKPPSREDQRALDKLLATSAATMRGEPEPLDGTGERQIDQPELFDDAGGYAEDVPGHANSAGVWPATGKNGAVS